MIDLKENALTPIAPEIREYSSGRGLVTRREDSDGKITSFYVKDVGEKYFVVITQKKEPAIYGGGTIVEVKRLNNIAGLSSSANDLGSVEVVDVKDIFGNCSDEVLAATRFISTGALQLTTKSLFFAINLIDLSKQNLDLISSDLKSIILRFEQL